MLKHIAVGVDLSHGAEEAVGYAVALARRHGAKVTMISVTTLPDASASALPSISKSAAAYAQRASVLLAAHKASLEALEQRLGGGTVKITTLLVSGIADRDVAKTAEEIGADLVVVGTHGRGFWGRLFVGSVAERTARAFEKSVLVARGNHHQADGGFARILVATDLAPRHDILIDQALAMAAPNAEIEIVHAWQDPLQSLAFDPAVTVAASSVWDEVEASVQDELAKLVARHPAAAAHQPHVTTRPLLGSPGQALIEHAEKFAANLIVVGSHSHRGVARFLLGSTAEAMLRHAPCAVLIAR